MTKEEFYKLQINPNDVKDCATILSNSYKTEEEAHKAEVKLKMKITEDLANKIMEGLFHLALSAYGNTESEWALDTAMDYALETLEKLMSDWEKGLGMKWEIIKTGSTMWVMDNESHRCLTFPIKDRTAVRHGHWIYEPKDAIEMMFTLPKCSECGHESADALNYCPNCGAKMDEVCDERI